MKTVRFRIESVNGHDEIDVPEEQVPEKVKEELEKGKWVTVEKENGESKILTEPPKVTETKEVKQDLNKSMDLLAEDEEEETGTKPEWKDQFAGVKSVTSTGKLKGG